MGWKTTFLGLVLVLGAAGCGSKTDNARAKAKEFKDRICACKDVACSDDVKADAEKWFEGLKASGASRSDFSEEDRTAIRAEFNEIRKCAAGLGAKF